MDINIAKKNLDKLAAHPKGNYTVSKEKLVRISSWNLFGRLAKKIQDREGKITAKVNQVIEESKKTCETAKTQAEIKPIKIENQKVIEKNISDLKDKQLKKPLADAQIDQNQENFLINQVDAHLTPYFRGEITEEKEDKERKPLIDKLYGKFKEEFPKSPITKGELEEFALDAYIKASSRHFIRLSHKQTELDPQKDMLPALQSSIAIDFKGMGASKVQNKIQAAVDALVIQKKEAALEKYLHKYEEEVKGKLELLSPEEANSALASSLPALKEGLKKDFPQASQEVIDNRAEALIKSLSSYYISQQISPNQKQAIECRTFIFKYPHLFAEAIKQDSSQAPLMDLLLKAFKNDSLEAKDLMQEFALERYLDLYASIAKEKIRELNINPDQLQTELNNALAKNLLPELKKGLQKNFPQASQKVIDTRADALMKRLASDIMMEKAAKSKTNDNPNLL